MANPVIDEEGTKTWYLDGRLHRTDGPAIEWSDGHKQWWLNGHLHRTDGPAVETVTGYKFWYLHGTSYPFDKWLDFTPGLSHEEKVIMKLIQ
jgi:hypothetical protein